MTPTDALGNDLAVGQRVAFDITKLNVVLGYLTEVSEGGIAVMHGSQLTPGKVVITVEFPVLFQPGKKMRIADIVRVVEPPSESERLNKLIEEKNLQGKPTIIEA